MTRAASSQTYYTVRYLVDRQRVADAYRAYAYFRWIDDRVDSAALNKSEAIAFMNRQKALMNSCYQGKRPPGLAIEEELLADLILADQEENSGLQLYIRNMMAAIDFDARRSGRLISRLELSEYTQSLAIAVTEVLHYFIGHDQPGPPSKARYQAATGAHIAHMLRDTVEDIQAGFFNIPRDYLAAKGINPQDLGSDAYRHWVWERTNLARACFKSGKDYLAHVENIRCRIAGYAYIARFEVVLDAIERMNYRLVPEYAEGSSLGAKMRMRGSVLALAFLSARGK